MKKLVLLFMAICISQMTFAQATDLVVDCQTPGWLSSKINYGDQQTVQNLKVTGYINKTDMKFIGTLITSRSLNGEIDLSECNIVGDDPSKDNVLTDFDLDKSGSIRVYRIPQSATKVEKCLYTVSGSGKTLKVDSLFFDCQVKDVDYNCFGGYNYTNIGYLHLAENVDSISEGAFATSNRKVKEVHLSPKTKYIGILAFKYTEPCNFEELDKLEFLGRNAFTYFNGTTLDCYYKPDTLIVPHSLKETFYMFAFTYRDGQHIFIGNNISKVSGLSIQYDGKARKSNTLAKLIFHIDNTIPPSIIDYNFTNDMNNLSTSTVYVPKGSKQAYLNSDWKNATIIELNPVESVTINEHSIILNKGEQLNLSASVLPVDADDKTIEWISEDNSIASVDAEGNVTAIKEGQTKVIAKSTATGIQDECVVVVRKNVEGISLNETELVFKKISETKQLEAIVTPDDATDKSVTWKSANEQICMVSNSGLVIATGFGSTLVIATTVDGGYMAYCTVTVESATGIEEINTDMQSEAMYYSPDGKRLSQPQRGINIMRKNDGTIKKVLK